MLSNPATSGVHPADFVTIALLVVLEGLLSADNAMVLAVLVLGLPKASRRRRCATASSARSRSASVATLLAVYLIRLGWVKLVGAGYLLYLALPPLPRQRRRRGARARRPRRSRGSGCRAFWATVVKVELTDIVFAIDSILVAVAMSPKIWVILTGGILGIVMMRLVIGQLLALVERYPPLVDGAFVIIAWVGIKLLIEYLHAEGYIAFEIPKWLSLGLIVVIFGIAFCAMRVCRKNGSGENG